MTDVFWMQVALSLAENAGSLDEVPIGAIVVKDNKIIGTGFNLKEHKQSALAHAEINAITEASLLTGAWRLMGCTLYSTLEPCIMCAGAIQQSRMRRVVYATKDPKGGALGSLYNIQSDERLNHIFEVESGLLEEEASDLLKRFFRAKRLRS